MMANSDSVAKVRITVLRDGARLLLMSRKNDRNRSKRGKLEFLGGHFDGDETAFAALLRELREEELTGTLAEVAEKEKPTFASRTVDHSPHYLFEMTINEELYLSLQAAPEESLGFELVPEKDLNNGRIDGRLTYRTQQILKTFGTKAGLFAAIAAREAPWWPWIIAIVVVASLLSWLAYQ